MKTSQFARDIRHCRQILNIINPKEKYDCCPSSNIGCRRVSICDVQIFKFSPVSEFHSSVTHVQIHSFSSYSLFTIHSFYQWLGKPDKSLNYTVV